MRVDRVRLALQGAAPAAPSLAAARAGADGRPRDRARRSLTLRPPLVLGLLLAATPALAQPNDAARTALNSTLTADLIAHLPLADNLFHLLETTQPSLITDRFLGGGLHTGQSARVGGFLTPWSQTLFRIGDVSITDAGGGPLLFPALALWESVTVATGMLGSDVDAAGLAISLEPRRPGQTWRRSVEAATSHFPAGPGVESTPAIARIEGWDRVAMTASGPVVPRRLGAVLAGSWTRGSQVERGEAAPVAGQVASAFAHLVFAPTDRDEVSTVGWLQRASTPFQYRLPFGQPAATTTANVLHAQSTWDRRAPGARGWRAFAGYTRRTTAPGHDAPALLTVDRLVDGPVPLLAGLSAGTLHRWTIGGRVGGPSRGSPPGRHTFEAGLAADGSGSRAARFFTGEARELVDGTPARIWRFRAPGAESFRHEMGMAAHVSDQIVIARGIRLEAGLRYDAVWGAADGAGEGVRWKTLLPRGGASWTVGGRWRPTLFAAYTRSAYRLPLDWLAVGDPAAPTADVYRWPHLSSAPGPLVARTGPGSGGDPAFSRLDPALERPRSDELVVGLDIRPADAVRVRLTGMTRSERQLVGLLNTGDVSYAVSTVFDPGGDVGSPADDRFVPIYDRRPESFGLDRWLLANVDAGGSTFEGIELTIDAHLERLTLIVGGTAGRSVTAAASRGFGPLENDQGVIGEIPGDPNAVSFARGRPFTDRAYTAKVVGVFRLPTSTTVGVVARYQDGQPFSRMLVVRDLHQGPEAVRAFAGGDSRFTFIGTLDARVGQPLSIGARQVDLVLDLYNLPGLSYSVEERATQPPDVRITTAVQPPRAVHVGLRFGF